MFKNIEIETPNSQSSFSFLAPRYKDFNNDVTFSEGDSFFDTAIRLTRSATRGQPLFTPSRNVPFTPILNGINGKDNYAKFIIEKLTTKSPLKQPKKIKFLDNLDVKAGANKENGPPVVKIVKEAVNTANIKPAKQVKNYPGCKFQGIRKRQPIKKPGTVLTIPKPFRFHKRKRSNVINRNSPKSPFISLAERIQQFLEKTPDRFKSKLVTMRSTSNYVNLPTKARSPFLRTKLRAGRIKMTNKENKINNDKVQSKPVDSCDIKSGCVKKTKPKITIPVSPHITKPKPPQQKPPSPPRIIKANPVPQLKEPFKPIVAHRKIDPTKYSLPGEKISQRKAEIREEKLKKEAQEQEKARKFKAQPLPTGSPDSLPPVHPLPTTVTKPFKLRTNIRGEKYQQYFHEKITELNKQKKEDLSFRAKPTPKLLPYRPKKSAKPLTEFVGFNLHTDARLEKRKAYDEQRNLREQEENILKERKQIEEEERNKQQIRQLRTELVHHAQPIKRYAPVKIEFANRKITKPVSPLIGEKRRKKLQALNESNIRNAISENVSTAKIVPQSKNNKKLLEKNAKENTAFLK
ncbi:hypothetical protein RhiirC2_845604 [Rhizophagus irregularis]|uniref:TPX2 C-terminal domain-containing protein n=1 Tax=Rhizophagus irregularis TaxID=588596 RepID=A0A2N1NPU1_9GLOM|nr:hypothetical protein RhiirC2_845604 [Rhizophagus irregularis]